MSCLDLVQFFGFVSGLIYIYINLSPTPFEPRLNVPVVRVGGNSPEPGPGLAVPRAGQGLGGVGPEADAEPLQAGASFFWGGGSLQAEAPSKLFFFGL